MVSMALLSVAGTGSWWRRPRRRCTGLSLPSRRRCWSLRTTWQKVRRTVRQTDQAAAGSSPWLHRRMGGKTLNPNMQDRPTGSCGAQEQWCVWAP
jgi:hypothetical protein